MTWPCGTYRIEESRKTGNRFPFNGDKVLIRYSTDIQNGDIGCFYVPGIGGVIKQKAYDRLHSLNPKYDDIFVNEEGATLIGLVLGKVTKEMIPSPDEIALFQEALEEQK